LLSPLLLSIYFIIVLLDKIIPRRAEEYGAGSWVCYGYKRGRLKVQGGLGLRAGADLVLLLPMYCRYYWTTRISMIGISLIYEAEVVGRLASAFSLLVKKGDTVIKSWRP
jgi:hypothetical protein